MRLLPLLLFILGCPKSNLPSVEEKERQEALKEMLLEEEDFDDIPESAEEDEEEDSSSRGSSKWVYLKNPDLFILPFSTIQFLRYIYRHVGLFDLSPH